MTLATGRNIPTQVSSLPLTQCFRVFQMIFFQTRRLSFFPLTSNGDVAKLTWSWSQRYQNSEIYIHYRYWYGYQSLKVSRWLCIRCSYDEHSNFFWGETTWRDLVTWSWVIWAWNFYMCEKDVWTSIRRRFLDSRKTWRGRKAAPSTARVTRAAR